MGVVYMRLLIKFYWVFDSLLIFIGDRNVLLGCMDEEAGKGKDLEFDSLVMSVIETCKN